MKLLLDENLPHRLRQELEGHELITVAFLGWSGIKNGDLPARAASERFDALITNDRGFEHQQDRSHLPLSVVLLMSELNTIEAIRPLCPALNRAPASLQPRSFVRVERPSA